MTRSRKRKIARQAAAPPKLSPRAHAARLEVTKREANARAALRRSQYRKPTKPNRHDPRRRRVPLVRIGHTVFVAEQYIDGVPVLTEEQIQELRDLDERERTDAEA
jgi:hypothetical protein